MNISINILIKLININLNDKQKKELETSTQSIVAYMDEIKNLDLDNQPETSRVTEAENVFREDEIEISLTQEEALQNAKNTYNGFFVVPYVFTTAL